MHGLDGLRCPWCHDALSEHDEVAVCRDCLAAHHEPCWTEADRCATCARTRPLTRHAPPRAHGSAAAAGWVRLLAGVAATYVVTGPLAGLVAAALYLLGASRQDYELPYLWFFLSWFVLFMGLAGAGGLWTISRLVALALRPGLPERPHRRRPGRPAACVTSPCPPGRTSAPEVATWSSPSFLSSSSTRAARSATRG